MQHINIIPRDAVSLAEAVWLDAYLVDNGVRNGTPVIRKVGHRSVQRAGREAGNGQAAAVAASYRHLIRLPACNKQQGESIAYANTGRARGRRGRASGYASSEQRTC